jgi:hydroxymethylpyrimidine kinase/phosphomethylpyrimidine kinase
MTQRVTIPCALTIAGSDSGGGAGIQADLKTFNALGVHGLSAITCLTAQNPDAVLGVQPTRPALLQQQLAAVTTGFKPAAIKTGMLYSRALIEVTARFAAAHRKIPLVVDPVMIATSGARLLNRSALTALMADLLPRATIITPNVPEAEALAGRSIGTIEDQRQAARQLAEQFGCAVVVKGGHLKGAEAADIFFDGHEEWLLTSPFLRGVKTHGTGCTFSAALAAHLAKEADLATAVAAAKDFVTGAIAGSRRAGRHTVLWAV